MRHRSLMLGDVSTLTDQDEHALEAIRRQLDMEFPHSSRSQEPGPGDVPAAARPPAPVARRTATTVGTLLLACAAGSAAGVVVTILYAQHVVAPTVARESPPPTPVTVTRPPLPASPPVVSRAERTDARLGTVAERPGLTPPSTPRSRPAAPVARTRAPEIVPATVSPSPSTTLALTPDPPDTWQALAEPSSAPPATPNHFRRYLESFKRDLEQAHGAPPHRAGPPPQAP